MKHESCSYCVLEKAARSECTASYLCSLWLLAMWSLSHALEGLAVHLALLLVQR